MRYCLLLVLLAGMFPADAQIFVNNVDVNLRPIQYIELWEKYNKTNDKFFAMLDYGQQDDLTDKEGKNLLLTNNKGQYLEFNGIVDALNFMYRNGWEVMQPKTIGNVQTYILQKREGYTPPVAMSVSVEADPAQNKMESTPAAAKSMVSEIEDVVIEPIPVVEVKRVEKKKTKMDSTKEKKK